MRSNLYISGTLREASDDFQHGVISILDENLKVIKEVNQVFPAPVCYRNTNPRGGVRGWRGSVIWKDQFIVANNDSLVFFDLNLNNINKIITHPSFGNIHNIRLDQFQNGIFITSTINETVSYLNLHSFNIFTFSFTDWNYIDDYLSLRGKSKRDFNPNKDYRLEWEDDILHLNYYLCHDNYKFALLNSLNMLFQLSPEIKILWAPDKKLQTLDTTDKSLYATALACPHDLYLDNNRLLINSSARSELVEFDLITQQLKTLWTPEDFNGDFGWLRGLKVTNEFIFVGGGFSYIAQIDRKTYSTIQYLKFTNTDNKYATFGIT